MILRKIFICISLLLISEIASTQNVTIIDYSVNNNGQVELEIEAEADKYYVLSALHEPNNDFESKTSVTMGIDGNMIISEPLAAYPLSSYSITAYSIDSPEDLDGDGLDDITELNNMPTNAPLNFAPAVPFIDGTNSVDSYETYSEIAVIDDNIPWAPFLNNQEFAKFVILNQNSDFPEVYFVNSNTHYIHADFINTIDASGADIVTGEVVYNPNEILPNGVIGVYSFNYSFGDSYSFEHTQRTFELLAVNMPYLKNNLRHFIGDVGESDYLNFYKDDFVGSRIDVVLESEFFADVDFIPFNFAEGFGFFRHMDLDDNPGSRDIVLYDALPNSLPRVGGIITSVIQTPLSHVNLRAIQDHVPNAYIQDPLAIDSISNLLGKYIYYKVDQDRYYIREATLEEVNDWYENIRPTEDQIPVRDLSYTKILPLDSIDFEMSTAFGAKCTNVATMRTFGFPENTIPDGFGIPFYYYDEFMKYNNFYERVELMIALPTFINDLEVRIDMLKDLRSDIKDAPMPTWMLNDLQTMHESFPEGTKVRCRSSTNNEDLPGFSGAGLYSSKTQHLDEGHISKSIKQVYASMWNFRAFDEREFYRVDQYVAAMGILCHTNFEEEKSNGVGVSIDPVYNTMHTFYLNTQVGESLITNPDANSIPEEILLNQDPAEGYFILRRSNLVHTGELVMGEEYLDLMRDYLKVIHDEFAILYDVVGAEGFGMDIEYKVTVDDQLIIKQARPWVSFWADIKANYDLALLEIVTPYNSATLGEEELISFVVANKGLRDMSDFEISLHVNDVFIESLSIVDTLQPQSEANYQFTVPVDFSDIGDYKIMTIVAHEDDGYSRNDTLLTTISHLHDLEGGLSIVDYTAACGQRIGINTVITNLGATTFNYTEIEVISNGIAVDTVGYTFNIPYTAEVSFEVFVTENLVEEGNEITLRLLRVNGIADAMNENNSASISADLDTSQDDITLIINPDDYPQETSWKLFNAFDDNLVAEGELENTAGTQIEQICVDYNSCFRLFLYDSYGDGICCEFGMGDFLVVNAAGDTLVVNDGVFSFETEELFCITSEGCAFETEIISTEASSDSTADGSITIIASGGFEPFLYSINGGETFVSENVFENLAVGIYDIVVVDSEGFCSYEVSFEVEIEVVININETVGQNISVFPNPTSGDIVIALSESIDLHGDLMVEVYDGLGRKVKRETITKADSQSSMVVSLAEQLPGNYFVRCYSQSFDEYFKIIKVR